MRNSGQNVQQRHLVSGRQADAPAGNGTGHPFDDGGAVTKESPTVAHPPTAIGTPPILLRLAGVVQQRRQHGQIPVDVCPVGRQCAHLLGHFDGVAQIARFVVMVSFHRRRAGTEPTKPLCVPKEGVEQ